MHKVCRDKQYVRHVLTDTKAPAYASLGLQASILRNHERVHASAKSTKYPVQLVLAEKDVIVSNKAARAWYGNVGSKIKKVRLMAGSYHCTIKEPNRDVFFEACLSFMGERLDGKVQGSPAEAFGLSVPPLAVNYYKPRPIGKRKKFWLLLLILAYLIVGFILAKKHGMKRLVLAWPSILRK